MNEVEGHKSDSRWAPQKVAMDRYAKARAASLIDGYYLPTAKDIATGSNRAAFERAKAEAIWQLKRQLTHTEAIGFQDFTARWQIRHGTEVTEAFVVAGAVRYLVDSHRRPEKGERHFLPEICHYAWVLDQLLNNWKGKEGLGDICAYAYPIAEPFGRWIAEQILNRSVEVSNWPIEAKVRMLVDDARRAAAEVDADRQTEPQ